MYTFGITSTETNGDVATTYMSNGEALIWLRERGYWVLAYLFYAGWEYLHSGGVQQRMIRQEGAASQKLRKENTSTILNMMTGLRS